MTRIDYSIVGRALMHPLQQKILEYLAALQSEAALQDGNEEQEDTVATDISPNRMADTLEGESVGNVSYHFKALLKLGWIKETRTVPVRGALEHFYSLSDELVVAEEPEVVA